MIRQVLTLLAATVAVAATLGGCGVPSDSSARQAPIPLPGQVRPSPTGAPTTGAVAERLFLTRDSRLVRVTRAAASEPTVQRLLQDLLAGPTAAERADGLSSALLGTDISGEVHLDNGLVTIELQAELDRNGRTDEVLALAQLVCTMSSHPAVRGVSFVRDGHPVSVPRADGSLSAGPLTGADYAALMVAR